MRIDGTLKTWDDERGFGFIERSDGGEDVFVHDKAIPLRIARPAVGMLMSFEVEDGSKGKKRAKNVELAPEHRTGEEVRERVFQPTRSADLIVIPLFAGLYLLIGNFWPGPGGVAAFVFWPTRPTSWRRFVRRGESPKERCWFWVSPAVSRAGCWRSNCFGTSRARLRFGWLFG